MLEFNESCGHDYKYIPICGHVNHSVFRRMDNIVVKLIVFKNVELRTRDLNDIKILIKLNRIIKIMKIIVEGLERLESIYKYKKLKKIIEF